MSISFSGLASGLDTSSWVTSLTALKQAKVTTLETQKTAISTCQEALTNIKSFFSSFRSTIEKITDSKYKIASMDLFSQNIATSANLGVLTASASTDAQEGVYNIKVDKLATNTEATSAYRYRTTIVETTTALSDSKLTDLSYVDDDGNTKFVQTGMIGVTVNGVEHGITIGSTDTIGTFVKKLEGIGVSAYFNEDTGIFTINSSVEHIRDNIDGKGSTGIKEALHLTGVNEGYKTNSNLEVDEEEIVYYDAEKTTALGLLSYEDDDGNTVYFQGGELHLQANGINYNGDTANGGQAAIQVSETDTIQDLIDKLAGINVHADLVDGVFTIDEAEILDTSTTNLAQVFGFENATVAQNAQKSSNLFYSIENSSTTVVAPSTMLKDLGTGLTIEDDSIFTVKNSNNQEVTITVSGTTTMDGLVNKLKDAGLAAQLTNQGTLIVYGGIINDNDGGSGMFDIVTLLGLSSEADTAMATGNSLTEEVTYIDIAGYDTKLVDDFGVTENSEIRVTNGSNEISTITVTSTMTVQGFMDALSTRGIASDFNIDTGVLTITGGQFENVSGNALEKIFGASSIPADNTSVASTNAISAQLKYTVTNTIQATTATTLGTLGMFDGNSILSFDVRGETRLVTVTDDMTVGGFISAMNTAGISATFDEDTARITLNNATLASETLQTAGFIGNITTIAPQTVVTNATDLATALSTYETIGIANAEVLSELSALVNSGTDCCGKTIVLTEDIDLSGYQSGTGWTAIGINYYDEIDEQDYFCPFGGTFDGQGHVVKNLYINNSIDCQGLFGFSEGDIKNVGVENCNVNGGDDVGGLVGCSSGSVVNCYVTGSVTGEDHVGGLVGGGGTGLSVTGCYSACDVQGNDYVGGLVGSSSGYITNSTSYATLVSGDTCVGSLVGDSDYIISNCSCVNISNVDKVGNTSAYDSRITYIEKVSEILDINETVTSRFISSNPMYKVYTTNVSATGTTLKTVVNNVADYSTKFSDLQITETDKLKTTVYNSGGTAVKTIEMSSTDDMKAFFKKLNDEGITASISSGVITMSSSTNMYISDTNGLATQLGISASSHSYISKTEQKSSSAVQCTTTGANVETTTKLKDFGVDSGQLKIHNNDGTYTTITVSNESTLGTFLSVLSTNNFSVNIDNGTVSITGTGDTYLVSVDNGSNVMTKLNLGAKSNIYTTIYTNTNSSEQCYDTTVSASKDIALQDLKKSDGTAAINFGSGSNITLTVSVTSSSGNVNSVALSFSKTSTLNDVFNRLSNLGIDAVIDSNGQISFSSNTLVDFDLTGGLGTVLCGDSCSCTHGCVTQAASSTATLQQLTDASGNSLNITSGNIAVIQNGTRNIISISNTSTLETLASRLSQYDITMQVASDGTIYFTGDGNSYLETVSDGGTNLLTKLNIAGEWTATTNSQSKALTYTDTPEVYISSTNPNVKLTELKDASGTSLGITAGTFDLYTNGVKSTKTITSDTTVGDFISMLSSAGMTVDISSDGRINVGAQNNTYASGDVITTLFSNGWNFTNVYTSNEMEMERIENEAITKDTKLSDITYNTFIGEITTITSGITTVTDAASLASILANYHYATIGIANADVLHALATLVNSGTDCSGKTIVLTDDIDLNDCTDNTDSDGWTAIGTSSNSFAGTFDGQGHVVKNLYINNSSADYQGLFGYATGELKNVGVENCDVTGNSNVGGLVGYATSTITNCYTTGDVTGNNSYVGGLVGCATSTVTNCYAACDVAGNGRLIGGLVGFGDSSSTITNCYSNGDVTGYANVGGLVGAMCGTISNSTSYATLVSGTSLTGSLVGFSNNSIANCSCVDISGLDKVANTHSYDSNISNVSASDAPNTFTPGYISVVRNGVVNNIELTADETVESLMDRLELYGFDSSISVNGQLVIRNTGDSYLKEYTGAGTKSNALDILGVDYSDGDWITTNSYESSNNTDVVTTETVRTRATRDTLLSDLGKGVSVGTVESENTEGITAGEYYIYKNGVKYTAMISSDTTVGDFLDTLNSFGLTASLVQYGQTTDSTDDDYSVIKILGNGDSYIAKSASTDSNIASNVVQKLDLTEVDSVYDYSGKQQFSSIAVTTSSATDETRLSYYDKYVFTDENITTVTAEVTVTDAASLASALSTYNTVGIANAEVLHALATIVNAGTSCSGKTIVLTDDIDLNDCTDNTDSDGWTAIGTSSNSFAGTFDGQGHVVKNLYINKSSENEQGLFGYSEGTIKNVGVENCDVTGNIDIGALVGSATGTIINCYVTGDVTGNSCVGGLVGDTCNTSIDNCYAMANVTGNSCVGGLVGNMEDIVITGCYATGDVTGGYSTGGLIGICCGNCTVTSSTSYATLVSGTTTVGSFVGNTSGGNHSISSCSCVNISDLNKAGDTRSYDSNISYVSASDAPTDNIKKSEGDLVVVIDGMTNTMAITADETIGTLLGKFRKLGVEATLNNGEILIESGFKELSIDADKTTSNVLSNLGLTFHSDLGGYAASSVTCTATTTTIEDRTISAAKNADGGTTMSLVNISAGSLSVYKNGQKATLDIESSDTFDDLNDKLHNTFADVSIVFEDGYLLFRSTDENAIIDVGSTTDKSNFVAICGLSGTGENYVKSSREIYKVSGESVLMTEGLFTYGTVEAGTFTIGNATFEITEQTTLNSIISQINSSDDANATAYWDSVDGKLVIKSRVTGSSLINIEAGTSNFTHVMGLTTPETIQVQKKDEDGNLVTDEEGNAVMENQVISKVVKDSQVIGENAKFSIDGTSYTSTSNTVSSDVSRIVGVTLNLKDITEGESVKLTIEKDKETVSNAVSDIVDAYNELLTNVDNELASTGNLSDQTTLKMLRNQLRNLMSSSITGTAVYKNLMSVGISTDTASAGNISTSSVNVLNFDSDKFLEAFNADSNAVKNLLVGNDSTDGIFLQVESLVEKALDGANGYFAITNNSYNKQIASIDKKIESATADVSKYKSRLESSFSTMDLLISNLQNQYSSFLS